MGMLKDYMENKTSGVPRDVELEAAVIYRQSTGRAN
jgi:hypothetical protein